MPHANMKIWSRRLIGASWGLLAIGYVVVSILSLWGRLGPTRIGVSVSPGTDGAMVVQRVHPGGAAWETGIRPGDILLTLDDRILTPQEWASSGDRGVYFTALRPGTNQILRGSTERGSYSPLLSSSLFFSGFVFALTSFFVFSRASRKPEVITLAFLLISAAWALTLAPAAGQWLWWAAMLEVVSVTAAAVLFYYFFLTFPGQRTIRRKLSLYMGVVVLATPVLMLGLWLYTILVQPSIFPLSRRLFLGITAASLTGGILLLLRSYFSAREPVIREQLRIMVVGTVAPVLAFVVLVLGPLLAGFHAVLNPELTVLGITLFPSPSATLSCGTSSWASAGWYTAAPHTFCSPLPFSSSTP